jgi:hypothetical protein
LAAAMALVVVAAASCSGGGGGGGGGGGCPDEPAAGSISSGDYTASCWHQVEDGCATVSNRNGDQITIAVAGTSFGVGLFSGTFIGTNIAADRAEPIDFNTDPYGFGAVDCIVDLTGHVNGITIGVDVADLVESYDVAEVSGAECADAEEGVSGLAGANVTFPCHSEAEFRITKDGI